MRAEEGKAEAAIGRTVRSDRFLMDPAHMNLEPGKHVREPQH